jgi:hypothetical protein
MLGARIEPRTAAVLAWFAFTLTVVAGGGFVVFGFLSGGTALPSDFENTTDAANNIVNAVLFVTLAGAGALIASRRPASKIGWILCLAPIALSWTTFVESVYVYTRYANPGALPFSDNLIWAANWMWSLGFVPLLTWLLLLFPDGRLLSSRWRPVSWLAAIALGALVLGYALSPGPLEDYSTVQNPLGIGNAAGDVLKALRSAGLPLLVITAVLSTASLVVRFRRSRGEQREQLKWVAAAGGVAIAGWIIGAGLDSLFSSGGIIVSLSITGFPVAVGIAVLKYRLYDIDVVINRTLVYGSLTATLATFYVGSVLLLERLLAPITRQSDLAIAASTLAAAAFFRPLRSRIQQAVDRRFFRHKYDAQRILEAFGASLRREFDIDALRRELTRVIGRTMNPAHVSLWLREPNGTASAEGSEREAHLT